MNPARFILASRSPRRGELLRALGRPVVQIDPPFADPPQPAHGDPVVIAQDLARRKAASVLEHQPPLWDVAGGDLLVAADTIVVAPGGTLLGQPADRAEAAMMLRRLLGHTHHVVTGVALARLHPLRVATDVDAEPFRAGSAPLADAGFATEITTFSDQAAVAFGAAQASWIERYLDSGDWRGKAGGYNLAQWRDISVSVDGDPTTVVGLPMVALQRKWMDHG